MNYSRIMFVGIVISLALATGCASVEKAETPPPPLSQQEKALLKQMGGDILPDGNIQLGKFTLDRRKRELSFPAKMNITEGELEVLICTPRGRSHESLLVADVDPFKLQLALIMLGFENGSRKGGDIPQGKLFDIDIRFLDSDKRIPVEAWLFNVQEDKIQQERFGWVFVGSSFDSEKNCIATIEGNIVNLWSFGNTILDNPSPTGDDDIFFKTATELVPPYKTPLIVYIYPKPEQE